MQCKVSLNNVEAREHLNKPRFITSPHSARCKRHARALNVVGGRTLARVDDAGGEWILLPCGHGDELEALALACDLPTSEAAVEYGRRPV